MKKIIFSLIVVVIAIASQSFYIQAGSSKSIQDGQSVYATYCMSCHMENGEGVEGAFPSLVKTGNLKDKNKLVQIILSGMRGPIVVKGVKYNAEMASISLSDQEVVDVINFIRNSWGNKAPLMKLAEVPLAKKAVLKGYQAY